MLAEQKELKDTFRNRFYAWTHTIFETPNHSRLWHYVSWPIGEVLHFACRVKITGTLPKKGAALIVSDHLNEKDPLFVQIIGITQGLRTIRQVSKRKNIDPRVEENQETQVRRTVSSMDHKSYYDLGLFSRLVLQVKAFYLNKFNPIPMDPGGEDVKKLFNTIVNELKHDRMVGIFYQGTRRPIFDLIDSQPGTAVLLASTLPKAHLNIPVIPVGISGTQKLFGPTKICIGKPFYLKDIPRNEGQTRLESTRSFIEDRIAELVSDPDLKPCWRLSKIGLTRKDLKEVYRRDPDMISAAYLIESSPLHARSREESIAELKLIDEHARFFE